MTSRRAIKRGEGNNGASLGRVNNLGRNFGLCRVVAGAAAVVVVSGRCAAASAGYTTRRRFYAPGVYGRRCARVGYSFDGHARCGRRWNDLIGVCGRGRLGRWGHGYGCAALSI